MKNILSKFKKWKSKKAAADLISIIISVVLIAALVLGIMLFLSNKVRQTAMNEINNTMNTITGIAEANRNNTDIVIPGGPGGGNTPILPEEPEGIIHNGIIPEGGTYYVGVTSSTTIKEGYTEYTAKYEAGEPFPDTINMGDVYVYGDYEYRYNLDCFEYSGVKWQEPSEGNYPNGWAARVLENKTSYEPVLSEINNKSLTSMDCTYLGTELENTSSLIIPETVIHLNETFKNCHNLTDASNLIINSNVIGLFATFRDCENLTGNIRIDTDIAGSSTFDGTAKPITITGSCSETTKAELAATATNGNVTY